MTSHSDIVTTGFTAVAEYLVGAGIAHEVIEHEETMSAGAEARAAHWQLDQVGKTIVLHDGAAYLLAIVPGSERLDLHKVRDLFGATRQLRLASEDEIARDFPTLEVGATPPVGPMVPVAEIIDRRLLEESRVLFAAGDHRHSVVLDPREIARVTSATVADICEE